MRLAMSAGERPSDDHASLDTRESTYGGTPLSWCAHGSVHCGNPSADHAAVAHLLLDAGADVPADLGGSDAVQAVLREPRR